MIADITGIAVLRPIENEIGARGAFLFALKVTGVLKSISEGTRKYPVKLDAFHPSLEAHQIYDAHFGIFKAMREIAREQWVLDEMNA
jgi:xylulokinase